MAKMKSNKLITNFPVPLSEEENQNLNLTLSGVLTGKGIWRPAVNASGDISWTYDEENSRDVPTPMNIRGPEGKAPFLRVKPENSHLEWSRDRINWQDTGQTTSGAVGPKGADGVNGTNGTNGTNGVTPEVQLQSFSHNPTDPEGTNGGTRISFYYGPDDEKNKTYSAFNGAPGQGGGGGSYLAGQGIHFTQNNTTINAKLAGPDIGFDTDGYIRFNTDGTDAGGFFNMIEGHETWASGGSNHVEGMWTWAKGQGNHAQNVGCSAIGYGVNAQGLWTCFISDSGDGGDKWWNHGAGASVEGICNKTRETTYSGENETRGPVHEGILKVIGNGHRLHPDVKYDPTYVLSDAFIFYRDGTMWAAGDLEVEGKIHGCSDSAEFAEMYYDPDDDEEYPIYESFQELYGDVDQLYDGLGDFEEVWDEYSGNFVNKPSGAGVANKYFLYNTFGGPDPWTDANNWLCNAFIGENGVYVTPEGAQDKIHVGLSGDYLPKTGGTVSGQLEVHGGSNFDSQFIKLTREGNSCGARIGLGSDTSNGTLALKTFNTQGQNTVQVNIKYNSNSELIQVQKDGNTVGHLIPAVVHQGSYTPSSDDGILHIVVEN